MTGFLERWAQTTIGTLRQPLQRSDDREPAITAGDEPIVAPEPADPAFAAARHEVAELLATAYRRYTAIERVGTDQTGGSGKERLAKPRAQSVHGVVE